MSESEATIPLRPSDSSKYLGSKVISILNMITDAALIILIIHVGNLKAHAEEKTYYSIALILYIISLFMDTMLLIGAIMEIEVYLSYWVGYAIVWVGIKFTDILSDLSIYYSSKSTSESWRSYTMGIVAFKTAGLLFIILEIHVVRSNLQTLRIHVKNRRTLKEMPHRGSMHDLCETNEACV